MKSSTGKKNQKSPTLPSLRYKRVPVCKECGGCEDKLLCGSVRRPLRPYNGIRFTADGFDCALPVAVDSHSVCSYKCLYCFSNFLGGHGNLDVGQLSLTRLEGILSGRLKGKIEAQLYSALKRDQKQPCPLQIGALTDPFDNIERNQGWALELPDILIRLHQPVRISTKGKLLSLPEYLDAYSLPDLVWVAFSLITPDNDLLAQVDRWAPSATERLDTMKVLSKRGVSTSLRLRPAIPGISDATPKHPKAYKELIERAAEAGARALSMEVLFCPGHLDKRDTYHWDALERLSGYPLRVIYREITPQWGSCVRPSRDWTENFVHSCREIAHACGLTFGISDPVWKELNDYGCCCGIPPDDPVFGNWQREQATNVLVEARKAFEAGDTARTWNWKDGTPPWAFNVPMSTMIFNTGIKDIITKAYQWADKLHWTWNDIKTARGPLKYFQGVLEPVSRDAAGDILYRYSSKPRRNVPSLWKV